MASSPLPLIPWSITDICSNRDRRESIRSIHRIVLQLFVLGYAEYGNKLIDVLHNSNDGDIAGHNGRNAEKQSLYFAWGATKLMPTYIKKEYDESRSDGSLEERFQLPPDKWINELPRKMRERAREGKLDAKDLTFIGERMNVNPEGTRGLGENVKIGTVVQVAMNLGEEKLARAIVNEEVAAVYRDVMAKWKTPWENDYSFKQWFGRRLDLDTSPGLWEILRDAQLGKVIGVNEQALEEYVEEGCRLIEKRFRHGPISPHADKSISELVKILDENWIRARQLDPSGSYMYVDEDEGCSSTFLRPGVTEEAIGELEELLHSNAPPDAEEDDETVMLPDKQSLPNDYKEFLCTTNGFYASDTESGLLYPIEQVGLEDCAFMYQMDMTFSLFPYEYLLWTETDENEAMSFTQFSCFNIGRGGDEGHVVLIPPSSVKPIVQRFEKVYAESSEKHKKIFEQAATDYYGSLEKVRNLEWLCFAWYHWDPDTPAWGSFRDHLYACIERAEAERRGAGMEAEVNAEKKREEEGGMKDEGGKKDLQETSSGGKANATSEGSEQDGNAAEADESNESIAMRVKRQRCE